MANGNFKIKPMNIETGGILIAVLNQSDARKHDFRSGDRILIKKGKKEINQHKFTLRNMKSGKEKLISYEDLLRKLK